IARRAPRSRDQPRDADGGETTRSTARVARTLAVEIVAVAVVEVLVGRRRRLLDVLLRRRLGRGAAGVAVHVLRLLVDVAADVRVVALGRAAGVDTGRRRARAVGRDARRARLRRRGVVHVALGVEAALVVQVALVLDGRVLLVGVVVGAVAGRLIRRLS